MKSNTLKFKAVVLAVALAGLSQASLHAIDAMDIVPPIDDPMDVELTPEQDKERENQFIEQMFIEIRDAVNATIDLVDSFVDKKNKESFGSFMSRCVAQIKYIEENILAVLEAELKIAQATQPNSEYTKALEKTYTFGKEQAYKQLVIFYDILEKHRKSADPKNALKLVAVLKPHLQKLISTATLDMIDNSLTDINQHLDSTGSIAKEIMELQKMVKNLRTKAAAMQNTVNANLLPIIQTRVQKL